MHVQAALHVDDSMSDRQLHVAQVAALEQEAAELRAAARRSSQLRLPAAGDVLASLGLDKWQDARLQPKVSARLHRGDAQALPRGVEVAVLCVPHSRCWAPSPWCTSMWAEC